MFDLKDIIELLPFIVANPAKCIYIIVASVALGFFIGKFFSGVKSANKKQLEGVVAQLKDENNQVRAELALAKSVTNSPFTSLANLDKLVNSNDSEVELSHILKVSIKNRERNAKKK